MGQISFGPLVFDSDSSTLTRDVARELGVRYVLEGSVRRAGERLRVTAQLMAACPRPKAA